jgi:hypothetical protein
MAKPELIIPTNSQSAWFDLVKNAHAESGYNYSSELENYLVLTLEYFYTNASFTDGSIAIKLLESLQSQSKPPVQQLRQVGDECLLLSGLFPWRAQKHNVSLSYYIGAGKQAYQTLSEQADKPPFNSGLFTELSQHFVGLMDILHLIRRQKAGNSLQ